MYHKELNNQEKLLKDCRNLTPCARAAMNFFLQIASFGKKIHPSNQTIADAVGCSVDHIKGLKRKQLIANGLITRDVIRLGYKDARVEYKVSHLFYVPELQKELKKLFGALCYLPICILFSVGVIAKENQNTSSYSYRKNINNNLTLIDSHSLHGGSSSITFQQKESLKMLISNFVAQLCKREGITGKEDMMALQKTYASIAPKAQQQEERGLKREACKAYNKPKSYDGTAKNACYSPQREYEIQERSARAENACRQNVSKKEGKEHQEAVAQRAERMAALAKLENIPDWAKKMFSVK